MPLVSKNVKRIENKVYEPKPFDYNNEKRLKQMETMVDFPGYKGLTADYHNYLALKNGSYAELVVMHGRGVRNLTNELSNELVIDAGNFFKALPERTNISFFAYSFRVNTQTQQEAWSVTKNMVLDELQNTTDPFRAKQLQRRLIMLDDQLKLQRHAEEVIWSREYLMEVFAPTKGALENAMTSIKAASQSGSAPFAFNELTKPEKKERMYILNNPATYLIGRA